jgi:hypothetical protein
MSKRFRRLLLLLGLAALAVSLSACERADSPIETPDSSLETLKPGVLQVCLYWGFAPFASAPSATSPTGDWQGWDVDYLKAFAAANGLGFEVVPMDFNDIWLQPGQDKCDIAGTGISDTQDRRNATGQAGAWSNTYYHVLRSFLMRKGDDITKVEDLSGTKAIVTQGSTAHIDLCYRMNEKGIHPCKKTDGDHPCSSFPGLSLDEFPEAARETDPTCVYIDYPRDKDETCAGADVAAGKNKYPDPFTYGGGYGSIQSLADGSSKGKCTVPTAPLAPAPAWPHCNRVDKGNAYSEPFSFVVRGKDSGLLKALNCYINSHEYPGELPPDLDPPCVKPPWTPDPDTDCPQ